MRLAYEGEKGIFLLSEMDLEPCNNYNDNTYCLLSLYLTKSL